MQKNVFEPYRLVCLTSAEELIKFRKNSRYDIKTNNSLKF